MKGILNTYCRIDGGKFLIVYLMLLATPFWFCVLPLFILTAPMKLMWQKKRNTMVWRKVSIAWLLVSLGVGFYCAFSLVYASSGRELIGFPLGYPTSVSPLNSFATETTRIGWVDALNLSIVAGTLMLPLTIASYIEARINHTQQIA